MSSPLIPQDDPVLARRLRRQLMGTASWLMFLLPLAYAMTQGWLRIGPAGLAVFLAVAIGTNAVFFLLVRSRWSERFADPSLTVVQIFASQLLSLAMLHYTDGSVRSALLTLFVASLFFGIFGLRQRHFLLLTLTAVGGYLALVLWETRALDWHHPRLRLEWLRLLVLAMIMLWLSLLGSYVANLRLRLERRNGDLAKATERLRQLVSHDELTGVFNRRHLLDILDRERERARRYGQPFSACLIDLDHFKQVNDTRGHAAGDDVLRGFAARMLACARKVDWVGRQTRGGELESTNGAASDNAFGRYGGEEFLLVLPHTPLAGARRCIERLRELVLATPFDTVAGPLRVTFSAGVAEYRTGEPVEDTLARADAALYRAKHGGRNRTECEPEAGCAGG